MSKKLDYRYDWETSDEIEFLDKLGSHTKRSSRLSPAEKSARYSRLLEGAILGYSQRKVWGDIKKIIAVQHLEMLIRRDNASNDSANHDG